MFDGGSTQHHVIYDSPALFGPLARLPKTTVTPLEQSNSLFQAPLKRPKPLNCRLPRVSIPAGYFVYRRHAEHLQRERRAASAFAKFGRFRKVLREIV
jgi:hypothetical protein